MANKPTNALYGGILSTDRGELTFKTSEIITEPGEQIRWVNLEEAQRVAVAFDHIEEHRAAPLEDGINRIREEVIRVRIAAGADPFEVEAPRPEEEFRNGFIDLNDV